MVAQRLLVDPSATARRPTLLIVDDEPLIRRTLSALLGRRGRVLTASSSDEAITQLEAHRVDVAFVDLWLDGDDSGLALLDRIRARWADVEVVICTVERDPRVAVQAMRRGASDFITKDFANLAVLGDIVESALERQRGRRELLYLRGELPGGPPLVVGRSPAMRELVDNARRVAPLPSTVLLLGESGSGKEMIARLLHHASGRPGELVAVNVAAIPRELLESALFGHEKGSFTGALQQQLGKFELADQGTLFLDEIGDLPLELQPKLLRALQERVVERIGGREPVPIDVRVVAATHIDLRAAALAGHFRQDLYYRLNVVPLRIPPLRERREDIGELVALLGRKHAVRLRRPEPHFTEEALALLSSHDWPGNVRELENLVERMLALGDGTSFGADAVPIEYQLGALTKEAADAGGLYEAAMAAFERSLLRRVLDSSGRNFSRAARSLGLHRNTLRYKLDKHHLLASDGDELL